jgi:hypothetical protein
MSKRVRDGTIHSRARTCLAELAARLGVRRSFVYEHADELGAYRLGSGPRARLRFDFAEVLRRTSCSVSRRSRRPISAPKALTRPGRRQRMGTTVELLPIRASWRGVDRE